jgi:K+-transporting ATPase A subunit
MKLNLSGVDRLLRTIIAVALIVLGLTGVLAGTIAIIGYILAAVFLLTALVGFCPLYAALKFNTRKV